MEFKKNSFGFTLVEVLVAITILAFLMLGVYKMVDNNTSTKEAVTKEDRALMQILSTLNRFSMDIEQIYSPLYYTVSESKLTKQYYEEDVSAETLDNTSDTNFYEGNSNYYAKAKNGEHIPYISFDQSTSRITFLTLSNRRKIENAKESRFAWISYSLRSAKDPEHSQEAPYELVRQSISQNLYLKSFDWENVREQVVLKNVVSIKYEFWDERQKKFQTSLNDLNENKFLLRALKINLEWIDESGHKQQFEKIIRPLWPYFNAKQDEVYKQSTQLINGANPNASDAGQTPTDQTEGVDTSE